MIGYFSGDFLDAQTHCERALEACTPGHEEKARERFGEYTGALVMSCLAITTWQLGKVERSGLKEYFTAIEVVAEKDSAVYRAVVQKYGLVRELTWMIGNSPKSDINPALEAGLHAVFVPHDNTWMLERDELRNHVADGRLLQVESFSRLRDCF